MITNRERERDREINEMFHDISDLTEVEDRYVRYHCFHQNAENTFLIWTFIYRSKGVMKTMENLFDSGMLT